ncbi:alpha-amylase family glycosyl hydrolase [Pontibacter toksunensis]|uniref:Alpha-amylase family glycosyl hydrolase n=1 Tax=Pontibacter toksunensis TaxID=1332631 RepID=A0ABW6BR30_9BACT
MNLFTFKKSSIFFLLFFCFCLQAAGQVVTTSPTFPTANEEVTITFDLSKATDSRKAGLLGLTTGVYLWSGAGTTEDGDAFQYQPEGQTNFAQPFEPGKMTYLGNNRWQIKIVPRQYFGVPDNVPIRRLGLLLKNANGTAQTEDLFVRIYPDEFTTAFIAPSKELLFTQANSTIDVQAASSTRANLTLKLDNTVVATATNEVALNYTLNTGTQAGTRRRVILEATTATETARDTFYFIVEPAPVVAALPAGVQDGINYINGNEVVLTLFAPEKDFVYVIGEFNNWLPSEEYLMKLTPDGNRYWLRLTGLPAGEEVAFQYLVDGTIAVADPYTEKILDPNNDKFLTDANYPDLKPYPTRANGIVSVLQTNQPEYNWQVENFVRPDVESLVIYELLVRDFVATRNYQTLIDTLSYLKSLNINAIQLMPVMEFSGNDSWGYNPTFFFAPDKAYGTEEDLKAFIDACHKAGIAVILDIVLNQADYENPYVRLYWDEANSRPAANNPYFNQQATHPFSVFFDFNHESAATKALVERVNRYWLEEYKIDGYRFDLSKGFTQRNTGNDVNAWSAYDASRVAIWKDIYQDIRAFDPTAYIILEHFAVNQEEKELAEVGMLFWGNLNHDYRNLAKGNSANPAWISYKERGWQVPHVIGYIESHDEERLLFDVLQNGKSAGSYNTRDLTTALNRAKLAAAFSLSVPGPKMIWQFGELGYDVSIEQNGRTGAKPLRWEYQNDPERKKLFNLYAELIKLKTTVPAFSTDNFNLALDGMVKRITLNGEDMTVFLIGNFDVQSQQVAANIPSTGTWYDHFTGDEVNVTNTAETITLMPGEFRMLTSERLPAPPANLLPWQQNVLNAEEELADAKLLVVYPNPIEGATVIELNSSYRGAVSLQVVDVTGRVLRNFRIQKAQQTLQEQLNLQGLAGGLYYLQVEQGGQKSTRKLVKLAQ